MFIVKCLEVNFLPDTVRAKTATQKRTGELLLFLSASSETCFKFYDAAVHTSAAFERNVATNIRFVT